MNSARSSITGVLAFGLAIVSTPITAVAASHTVNPGDSIQAAIDAAAAGDVVKVMPGDYIETHGGTAAVRITKRLKLIARSQLPDLKVRILPDPGNPGQTDGILIEPEFPGDPDVERVLVSGFTVEGFENNGIWLRHVNKFKIKNNESINNLENGIWPTLSARGLVKNNVSYGALDSGLWVEASENVRIIKNEIYNNPTGLEVTISKKLLAKANDIHDNTVGVGLYHPNAAGLPSPFPLEESRDWRIIANTIVDNNFPNPVSSGLVGALPPGIGALLIGVDGVTMSKNTIQNNTLAGISMVDWCLFNDCVANPPLIEEHPDDNYFYKNTVTGNGAGSIDPEFAGLEADILLFTVLGHDNCFQGNIYGTELNLPFLAPLPTC